MSDLDVKTSKNVCEPLGESFGVGQVDNCLHTEHFKLFFCLFAVFTIINLVVLKFTQQKISGNETEWTGI